MFIMCAVCTFYLLCYHIFVTFIFYICPSMNVVRDFVKVVTVVKLNFPWKLIVLIHCKWKSAVLAWYASKMLKMFTDIIPKSFDRNPKSENWYFIFDRNYSILYSFYFVLLRGLILYEKQDIIKLPSYYIYATQ
jgi:hypothetical protein